MTSGVTDGRQSYLTLQDYLPGATQAWVAIQKQSHEMGRSQYATTNSVINLPHVGWQLQSLHIVPGDAAWFTDAQAGNLSVANGATVPGNYAQPDTFSQQSGIAGISYATTVQTIGTPKNVHRPPAGTNWSADALTADQAAFPSPNTSEDPTQMLRVMVTPQYPESGSPAPGNNLLFTIWIPGAAITPRGSLATVYFNGPAGDATPNPALFVAIPPPGSGQYSLKFRGDGFAYLYELSQPTLAFPTATWMPRFAFLWNKGSSPLNWTMITVMIHPRMWQDQNDNWCGDTLTFGQTAAAASPNQLSPAQNMAQMQDLSLRMQNGLVSTYKVPRLTNQPMTICPVRMDVAIDVRALFDASKHVHVPWGYVQDDPFTFDQPATSADLLLIWSGALTSDCRWSAVLYDQNWNACTATSPITTVVTSQGSTSYQSFSPTSGMTGGSIRITLYASSDTFSTPTLTDWGLYGIPVYQNTNPVTPTTIPNRKTPPALWENLIEAVEISPQTSDPGGENAIIIVNDFTGSLDSILEYVNFIPVHLWCTDTSLIANPTGASISIFRGYCLKAMGKRMRTEPGQTYPNQLWTQWTLVCVGEWARLQDAVLPRRVIWQDLTSGATSGTNAAVTDAVANMLRSVYPSSMVQVPSSSIRLFGTSADTWTTEPGMRISDLSQTWMQDYFGGWCLFDEGASVYGMQRGYFQKTPPYNNLAVFEMDHPTTIYGDGKPRLPQVLQAYGYSTGSNGQIMQHAPMFAGTFEPHTERAEGNCVIVYGGGPGSDAQQASGSDGAMFSQFAINVNSFNFLNLPPGSPGYPNGTDPSFFGVIKPIRVYRYDLPNQNAVNWYCRRIFDRSCYARYYISFEAPLLYVTDKTDPYQSRPRRLHYDDPVLVRQYDGTLKQFLVVTCSPSYVRDNIQVARYLLVTQANINQRAVVPATGSSLMALKKAQSRLKGLDESQAPANWTSNKYGHHINSEVMALPTLSGYPIQDLNPSSPTFGEFYAMNGYTGLGDIIA